MSELKPNSYKYREEQQKKDTEEKRVEKVVTGVVKKKSAISKAAGGFFNEDASTVKSYLVQEVLIPGTKKLISDIIKSAVDSFFGTSSRSSSRDSISSRVSYRKYYDDPRDDQRLSASSRFDYEEIGYPSRGAAELVLDHMEAAIERYKYVTVFDMYDLSGCTPPYTSNRYGWTSLRTAEVYRRRDGDYGIRLPKAMPID